MLKRLESSKSLMASLNFLYLDSLDHLNWGNTQLSSCVLSILKLLVIWVALRRFQLLSLSKVRDWCHSWISKLRETDARINSEAHLPLFSRAHNMRLNTQPIYRFIIYENITISYLDGSSHIRKIIQLVKRKVGGTYFFLKKYKRGNQMILWIRWFIPYINEK